MTRSSQTNKVNAAPKARPVLDPEDVRLAKLQWEWLGLGGAPILVDAVQSLAAAARERGVE